MAVLDELGRFADPGFLILASLAAGEKHGYAIMEDIAAFSGMRFEPGTLYGALARLEHAGLVEALPAQERRRPYRITEAGRALFEARLETLERVVGVTRQRLQAAVTGGSPL